MKIVNGMKLFSTPEVCELLGVTGASVSRMRKKGLLHSIRMGRAIYTSEQALSDYLNGKTTEILRKERAKAEAEAKAMEEQGKK